MDDQGRAGSSAGIGDIIARLRLEVDEIVALIGRPTSATRDDHIPPASDTESALGGQAEKAA